MAGVTAHRGYTAQFAEELKTPGIRVPLTADPQLCSQAADLGRQVLWLHTYGQRFSDSTHGRRIGPPRLPEERRPKAPVTISDRHGELPDTISDDEALRTLHVGGQIRPVSPEAWAY